MAQASYTDRRTKSPQVPGTSLPPLLFGPKMQTEVGVRGLVSAPPLTYYVTLSKAPLSLQACFFHSKIQIWVV